MFSQKIKQLLVLFFCSIVLFLLHDTMFCFCFYCTMQKYELFLLHHATSPFSELHNNLLYL